MTQDFLGSSTPAWCYDGKCLVTMTLIRGLCVHWLEFVVVNVNMVSQHCDLWKIIAFDIKYPWFDNRTEHLFAWLNPLNHFLFIAETYQLSQQITAIMLDISSGKYDISRDIVTLNLYQNTINPHRACTSGDKNMPCITNDVFLFFVLQINYLIH